MLHGSVPNDSYLRARIHKKNRNSYGEIVRVHTYRFYLDFFCMQFIRHCELEKLKDFEYTICTHLNECDVCMGSVWSDG